MKNTYFFIFFTLLFYISPGLFAENQDQELIKIKQELKDLADIRYKNLIELKKEQRNINRRINRLQYSLKFRTDSIFNLLGEAELNSGDQVSMDITEKNIKKSLNEDLKTLKKELKAEISKTDTQKSGFISEPLWFIVFGGSILVLIVLLFTLLYKKLNKTNNNLNAGLEAKEQEINKIKSDIHEENRQLSRSINNNRTLTNEEIKGFSEKLKEDHRLMHEYIICNDIESLDMKCRLLSIGLKTHEVPEDHSLAINIGNGLHKSKQNTEEHDADWKSIESEYTNCGYELINEFGNDFKDNGDLDIEWQEDNKLNEGECLIKEITKPIILYKKNTIQKGQITAIKSA